MFVGWFFGPWRPRSDLLVWSVYGRDALVASAFWRDPLVGSAAQRLTIHAASAGTTSVPLPTGTTIIPFCLMPHYQTTLPPPRPNDDWSSRFREMDPVSHKPGYTERRLLPVKYRKIGVLFDRVGYSEEKLHCSKRQPDGKSHFGAWRHLQPSCCWCGS